MKKLEITYNPQPLLFSPREKGARDEVKIEGGWELPHQESNFGILAFPHPEIPDNVYTDKALDDISDKNIKDQYRFLYLWRTYCEGGTTYKLILK